MASGEEEFKSEDVVVRAAQGDMSDQSGAIKMQQLLNEYE